MVFLFPLYVEKLSLCLIKYCTMKVYVGVDVEIHIFLTSALVGGKWCASRPGRWVSPRVGLDDMEKRNFATLPGLQL
jgi:hypothetical protein